MAERIRPKDYWAASETNLLKEKQSRMVNRVRCSVRRIPMLNRHLPMLIVHIAMAPIVMSPRSKHVHFDNKDYVSQQR